MTWGFVTPGHFFAPGLSGFPGVLAPRLLGGRMLAGGWRVKNGPIGLDQKAEALPMTSGDAISAGRSRSRPVVPSAALRYREAQAGPADSVRMKPTTVSGLVYKPVSDRSLS